MSLYTIGDLHLSFDCDKPMDIFKGWDNYVDKLKENWNALVSDGDCVVIVGDISWAMTLEKAYKDFKFINDELKGSKIILKGNHDYWWNTVSKMEKFLIEKNLDKIKILHNNSYLWENKSVCGTRGWINDTGEPLDRKVLNREAGRLEASIQSSLNKDGEPVVFLHYPPIYGSEENHFIIDILRKYEIKRCYYGHIHGNGARRAFTGAGYGTEYFLVSADLVGFKPVRVE